MTSMLLRLLSAIVAQLAPSEYFTPDSKFEGVEPPAWVLHGAVKVFLPLEDHKAIDTVLETAKSAAFAPLWLETRGLFDAAQAVRRFGGEGSIHAANMNAPGAAALVAAE